MLIAKFQETELQIPVENGSFNAASFSKLQIKPTTPPSNDPNETVPCRLYDPGFKNTAVCKTSISNVDPDGKLYYRGYDVEQLFERSSYLEVAYLLIYGELPGKYELETWVNLVMSHTYLHTDIERQMLSFRHDAHPMAMLIATISSLSTFTPDANPAVQQDPLYVGVKLSSPPTEEEIKEKQRVVDIRQKFILRALGKIPTIASAVYRHRQGRSYNHPKFNCLNYTENLLYMMDRLNEPEDYQPDPRLVKILDKLFILLAEVLKMLDDINSVDEIPAYLETVKISKRDSQSKSLPKISPLKLMGFGHRIYKNSDPRSILCKKLVFELFELMGKNKRAHIALELEEQVLGDEYFVSRKLFPNIDFWLALAFDTLGFPSDMFAIWMFIPRVSGFLAHWVETLDDAEYKIFRPRQIYVGQELRLYIDITSNQNEPKLRSQAPVIHRPQSMYARTDEFGSAGVLEELGDIDFDMGAKQTSQSKLSSWWQKQFKAEKPIKSEPSDQVNLLKQQIKLLTARVAELEDHGSVVDGPRSKQSSQLASKQARVIDPKGSK